MENKSNTPTNTSNFNKKITARDKYNTVVENFIKKLENNDTVPWTKSWNMITTLPKNFETKNQYQGMNILTLLDKGYKDSRWLTFNQVKKLGGKVKEAQKSTPIFFMKPVEKTIKNEKSGKEEIEKYFLMQSYNVFNIEQTEGIEYEKEIISSTNQDATIEEFIKNIAIQEFRGEPAYSPKDDAIFMPHSHEFENSNEFYSTYFHELSHSTGHQTRLDRFEKYTVYGDERYAFEELIAELGSAFLGMEFGLKPNSKKQASYLSSWITALKEKPNILYSAASSASKSTNYLMDLHNLKQQLKGQYNPQRLDINLNLNQNNNSKKVVSNTSAKTFAPKAS